MDQIFAPWRIQWVERDDDEETIDGCPFCVLPERDDDYQSRLVARSEHSFVLLNNYPYNPGHAMVIPRRHTGDFTDLSDDELLDHARLKQRTLDALREAMGPAGFNVGENLGDAAAGGSIGDHLHTHIVPRWDGDTNFMPVLGDTKVIVEALDDTYERLHAAFADQSGTSVPDETSAVHVD
ncbi:HIT family protein [Halogranum rubrum]|uniref:Hit family hydrolase, diadenosine tetraphosphate hydrolase n=1 Tax=Halogranum salarium B-1 TaxID=1210908 RepID=J3JES8_9EURY|nr:HIT domain-containing protein [Halogranum salarium]EJN58624.1 hit family hydrolase, diadenosine tetraphosphate hydrolase [Halogranum salarium B-1]